MTNAIRKLLTGHQAADLLGLSHRTLEAWRLKGYGPAHLKLGSSVRYELAELELYMEEQRRRSTSDPGPNRLQERNS